jgi:hypothetical protein
MASNSLRINPPLYLIGKVVHCWKCQAKMPAVAILAPHIEDTEAQVCILSEVESMPNEVTHYIQSRVPSFKLKYSKTAAQKYFANTCPKCGILSGDFFFHSEPGAPFFPTDDEEAKQLYMTKIPISKPVEIKASLNIGVGELILENAKEIE